MITPHTHIFPFVVNQQYLVAQTWGRKHAVSFMYLEYFLYKAEEEL